MKHLSRIYDLERFGLNLSKINRHKNRTVHLHVYFKSYQTKPLLRLKPKARLDKIVKWYQQCLNRVIKSWPNQQYTIMRSKDYPYGLKSIVKLGDIKKIRRIREIETVWIEKIKGLVKIPKKRDFRIYGVKTRQTVVIKSQNKGLQHYIEHILAVKARTVTEAKRLAKHYHRYDNEPYINYQGEIAYWRFDGIVDIIEAYDRDFDNGVLEVYHVWKTKRIKKQRR